MPNAHVRHILLATEEEALELKSRLDAGENFPACASRHSLCPTGRRGGNLGLVVPGQLAAEVDAVVFSGELRRIHGPVRSSFGYHLIQIMGRAQ